MQAKDWTLKTEVHEEYGTCVHVTINEKVNIDGLMFRLLDDERKVISSVKVKSRDICLCVNLAKPEFVSLVYPEEEHGKIKYVDKNVKYVDGSGCDFYEKQKDK